MAVVVGADEEVPAEVLVAVAVVVPGDDVVLAAAVELLVGACVVEAGEELAFEVPDGAWDEVEDVVVGGVGVSGAPDEGSVGEVTTEVGGEAVVAVGVVAELVTDVVGTTSVTRTVGASLTATVVGVVAATVVAVVSLTAVVWVAGGFGDGDSLPLVAGGVAVVVVGGGGGAPVEDGTTVVVVAVVEVIVDAVVGGVVVVVGESVVEGACVVVGTAVVVGAFVVLGAAVVHGATPIAKLFFTQAPAFAVGMGASERYGASGSATDPATHVRSCPLGGKG